MRCLFCNQLLPTDRCGSARYCDTNCRSAAYRDRRRTQHNASRKQVEDAAQPSRTPSSGEPAHANRHISSARLLAALESVERLVTTRRRTPRVDMLEQIRSQAPHAAVGYRLVLPPRVPGGKLRFFPRPRGTETRSQYRLTPFELPDDPRLRGERWYRLMWVDSVGNPVAPAFHAPVPGLYFFTGPPQSDQTVTELLDDAVRTATGTPLEAQTRKRAVEHKLRTADKQALHAELHTLTASGMTAVLEMKASMSALKRGQEEMEKCFAAELRTMASERQNLALQHEHLRQAKAYASSRADSWATFGQVAAIGIPTLTTLILGFYVAWKRKSSGQNDKPFGLSKSELARLMLKLKRTSPLFAEHLEEPLHALLHETEDAPSMASTDPPPQPVPLTPPPTLSTPLPAPLPAPPPSSAPPPPAPPPPPQPTSEVSSPKAISPPLAVPTSIGEIQAHLTTGLSIKQIRFIIDTVLAIEQSAYAEYEWKKLLSNSKEAGTIAEPVNTLSGEERKSIKKRLPTIRRIDYIDILIKYSNKSLIQK